MIGIDREATNRCAGGEQYSFARLLSRDADEHAARLSARDQVYEQLTPGPFEGSLVEALFRDIQLFRETTNQVIHESGSGRAGAYMFGVPVDTEVEGYHGGRPICRDSVIVLRDGQELDLRAPPRLDLVAVSMPIDALSRYAREVEQRDIERELRGVFVTSPPAARVDRFRKLLLMAPESISYNPEKLQHPAMQKALGHAIFGAVLDVLEPGGEQRPGCDAPTRGHAIVSRAQDYMREHVEEPLTIEDLCRELGVSRRTLQYSFREVLRVNPVSYLRALRLNGVRRALKAADQRCGSVQDIAARWGFWHLSHFASDYRRMFGELPSETLSRSAYN
ncbi:MAG: helix-turn-helix domain-containing protein [Burkholderiaceae bacterium]|nr:helix-turn-helix domain-containing protein [Burkholderiaceae bacterium]